MNILFIEDDKELLSSGVAQLETKGYRVYPAFGIADAQAMMEDPDIHVDLVITDHQLPDGLGIQFLIDLLKQYPRCKCVVVSGCLTQGDIEELESHGIPYHHKPLLYSKVVAELRRSYSMKAPERVEAEPDPAPQPEQPEPASELPEPPQKSESLMGRLRRFWPDI